MITSSLLNKTYRSLKEIVREFYFKRIKRIFPALTFYVVITSLLICFFDPEPLINLRTGIASIFAYQIYIYSGIQPIILLKQQNSMFLLIHGH